MILYRCATFTLALYLTLFAAAPSTEADTLWKHHAIDRGLSGGDGVRLQDADGDGDPDVVVGWEQAGVSRLYLNPGATVAIKKPWPLIDVGKAPHVEDAVMADVDGDGRMDVISACEGNTKSLIVHFAPTSGNYSAASSWTSVAFPKEIAGNRKWMFSITFDVNKDGHLDIISGAKDADAKIAWFEAPTTNKRDLATWKFHEITDVGWVMSLVAEDMDGDKDIDIVVSDRRTNAGLQGAWWLENPGSHKDQSKPWAHHFISEPNVEAMFLRLHDLDGDGDRDVVVPIRLNELSARLKNANTADPDQNPSRLRWYERLDATGKKWRSHEIAYPADVGRSKGTAVGDIDGNGRLDIVLSHATANAPLSGMVWLSYKNSVFDSVWQRHEISGPNGSKYDRVELLDVDGDGDLDAMTTEENFGKDSLGLGAIWYENPTR